MDSLHTVKKLYAAGRYRDAGARCRALIGASMSVDVPGSGGRPSFVTVLYAQTTAGLSSIALGEIDRGCIELREDMRRYCQALTGRGLASVIAEIHEPEIRRHIAHGQARLVELTIAELESPQVVNEMAARALRVASGSRVTLASCHAEHQMLRTLRYLGRHEHATEGWHSLSCRMRSCTEHGDPVMYRYLTSRSLAEAVATMRVTGSHTSTCAQLARELDLVAADQGEGDPWVIAVAAHLGSASASTAEIMPASRPRSSVDGDLHRLRAAAWFDGLREPGSADVHVYAEAIADGPPASRLYYPWQSLLRRRRDGVVPIALCRHLDRMLALVDPNIVRELDLPRSSFGAYLRRHVLARIICL